MAIDPSPLAQEVARFMDAMEEEHGEDAQLIDAVIAIEIRKPDSDGDSASIVEVRSIGKRNTPVVGILYRALKAVT